VKVGDSIEICPGALTVTQEIISLLEVSRGASLIIDYGEDHAFSNSFRGFSNHTLIKDFPTIFDLVGTLDLTSYVNFAHIRSIADSHTSGKLSPLLTNGPIPQGLFLECMGIRMRLELLQKAAKTKKQRD